MASKHVGDIGAQGFLSVCAHGFDETPNEPKIAAAMLTALVLGRVLRRFPSAEICDGERSHVPHDFTEREMHPSLTFACQ
ncbi:hypothetical protein PHLCEN_2v12322 [Hermanssonia centrifuga]|uniref:Uncharacterized protein n=1 Tax=Hermanssonia centrifuga TaxID=98765 RepID=A0A2R6NHR1_9APHY|nr:hypothetical protein PHLCEN_2v12322 [Hermanssonia centrifuga]